MASVETMPPEMVTATFRGGPLHMQRRRVQGYPTFRVLLPACVHDENPEVVVYRRTERVTESGHVVYEAS